MICATPTCFGHAVAVMRTTGNGHSADLLAPVCDACAQAAKALGTSARRLKASA